MKLANVRMGRFYRIVAIGGNDMERRRLLDMGFTPERKIFTAHSAPFGGTILIRLGGFSVALRSDAAALIEVDEAKA